MTALQQPNVINNKQVGTTRPQLIGFNPQQLLQTIIIDQVCISYNNQPQDDSCINNHDQPQFILSKIFTTSSLVRILILTVSFSIGKGTLSFNIQQTNKKYAYSSLFDYSYKLIHRIRYVLFYYLPQVSTMFKQFLFHIDPW